jgi:hypothetical protein
MATCITLRVTCRVTNSEINDGVNIYRPGDLIELSDSEAARLLALGAVEAVAVPVTAGGDAPIQKKRGKV